MDHEKSNKDTHVLEQSDHSESLVDAKEGDSNVNTTCSQTSSSQANDESKIQKNTCGSVEQKVVSSHEETEQHNEACEAVSENKTISVENETVKVSQSEVSEQSASEYNVPSTVAAQEANTQSTCESHLEQGETSDAKLTSDESVSSSTPDAPPLQSVESVSLKTADAKPPTGESVALITQDVPIPFAPQSVESDSMEPSDVGPLETPILDATIYPTPDTAALSTQLTESVPMNITEGTVDSSASPNTSTAQTTHELSDTNESLQQSSLSLLAAYDSNSDSDDVYEVPATQTYQNRVVELDSDSSSSDVEVMSEIRGAIDLDLLGAGHGEEDDEENIRNSRSPKVKGELHLDDLPPIQDLHITVPEEECTELGHIQSIIEQLVIVNSLPGTVPLDLDTVLFLNKGKQVLGEIFDVLGQVSDPLYCIRFNSNKEIKQKGIEVGQLVYVAPRTQHTQFVVLANLMKDRGSDASWENDIEPPERYLDYSDDEEERSARRSVRNKNRPSDAPDDTSKRPRPAEQRGSNNYGALPTGRPYRGNLHGHVPRQPHYQHPGNYNIAGNSWHSNFYQNYVPPPQQYRMPMHPPSRYRFPPRNVPQGIPPPQGGLVLNPYAVLPPPPLMQQPLFPPHLQQPPPPPPAPQ